MVFWKKEIINRLDNVEYKTNEFWNGKPVYAQRVTRGDMNGSTTIASAGVLVSGVSEYLLESGTILRLSTGNPNQIQTLGNVSNIPDQHVSIIWYNPGNKEIAWYYNPGMTLTNFKNSPFIANLKYTKV